MTEQRSWSELREFEEELRLKQRRDVWAEEEPVSDILLALFLLRTGDYPDAAIRLINPYGKNISDGKKSGPCIEIINSCYDTNFCRISSKLVEELKEKGFIIIAQTWLFYRFKLSERGEKYFKENKP